MSRDYCEVPIMRTGVAIVLLKSIFRYIHSKEYNFNREIINQDDLSK